MARTPVELPTIVPPERGIIQHRYSLWLFVVLVGLICLLFLTLFFSSLPQFFSAVPVAISSPPLLKPDGSQFPDFQFDTHQALIYARPDGISLVPFSGGSARMLSTPGYLYNQAVPPQLTPSGQIVYSGVGIWLLDPLNGHARQIVSLPEEHVVTSLVLSQNGDFLGWSSRSRTRAGNVEIHAGPLESTSLVYQQDVTQCPCMRVYSWLPVSPGSEGEQTLLLTTERSDVDQVSDGLWRLVLRTGEASVSQVVLAVDPPQGLLAFDGSTRQLVYTRQAGYVALPQDGSVPAELTTTRYANELVLASLAPKNARLQSEQTLVSAQPFQELQLADSTMHYQTTPTTLDYHWITTPRFSPDGTRLVYSEFTSDREEPFARHSTIFLVDRGSSSAPLSAQKLVSAPDSYVEVAGWFDAHTLLVALRGSLYALALDGEQRLTRMGAAGGYGQCVGVIARM